MSTDPEHNVCPSIRARTLIPTLLLLILVLNLNALAAQSGDLSVERTQFLSRGDSLSGAVYLPADAHAAVVLVHGSGRETRMTGFAERLARAGIAVLTYDKRGVGESGGTYAGPEVGTNNIDTANLRLLAHDASAAVGELRKHTEDLPIGLLGFSQAGWIIPLATAQNPAVKFMVLFSCPTITTLEQLRFQFFTDGDEDFWEKHTAAEARERTLNDPDRYQFTATDPKTSLDELSVPGLWLYGERDIQVPVKMCIEQLNALRAGGKPFEYVLFPALGHNTAFAESELPVEIALRWIERLIDKH